MAIICPKCKRKIVSLSFSYCLYCKEPFDKDTLDLVNTQREEANKNADKDFIRLQYEYKLTEGVDIKHAKTLKVIATIFLLIVAIGILFLATKVFMMGRGAQPGTYAHILYFSAVPITIVMLALIAFMIYRILK